MDFALSQLSEITSSHTFTSSCHIHTHTNIKLPFTPCLKSSMRGNCGPLNLCLSSLRSGFLPFSRRDVPVSYNHDSWSGQSVNVTHHSPYTPAQKARTRIKHIKEKRRERRGLSQLEECKHVYAQKTMLKHADTHSQEKSCTQI